MVDESTKARVEAVIKELDGMISQLIALKGKLEAIYALQANPSPTQTHADGTAKESPIVEEFPMPNPDALNRGPLAWLLRKLEEEDAKGHMEAWHSIRQGKVRFEIRLKPQATPEDRKKLDRWFAWVRKVLEEERQR